MTGNPYESTSPHGGQPSQPAQPGYQQQGYVQQPYGQPQPYPAQPYPAPGQPYTYGVEHPNGTAIMVLGILGFFTVVTGIIAWVMGRKALKEIDASGQTYTNRSQVNTGYICGMISTLVVGGFVALYLLFFIVYMVWIVGMVASMS